MWEAFDRTVKRVPNHKFLGTRNLPDAEGKLGYSWRTFTEVYSLMDNFARGNVTLLLMMSR